MLFIILSLCLINNLFSMEEPGLESSARILNGSEKSNILLKQNHVSSLQKLASRQVVKNLFNTDKRALRQQKINKIQNDSIEKLVNEIPEILNINAKNKLWYLCRVRASLMGFESLNNNIVISPCSKYISFSTGVTSKKYIFLNSVTNEIFLELDAHGNPITYSFSPCGKFLVVAHEQEIAIYENETGINIATFKHKEKNSFIIDSKWSPCGKYILTKHYNNAGTVFCDKSLILWDIESGDTKSFEHRGYFKQICFSSDSKYLITRNNEDVLIFDCQSGEQILDIPFPTVSTVSNNAFFNSNNKYIIVVCNYTLSGQTFSEVLLYDTQYLQRLPVVLKRFNFKIASILFSQIADQFVFRFENDNEKIILLNLNGDESVINLKNVKFIKLSRSGKLLLTAIGKKATIWDAQTGKKSFNFNFKKLITGASFDSNEKIAFSLEKYIYTIPTPESLLNKENMKTRKGLEKILHLVRKKA